MAPQILPSVSANAVPNLPEDFREGQVQAIHRYTSTRTRNFNHCDDEIQSEEQEDGKKHSKSSHGHGHAEKPKSIFTAFASAVINFLLMFGLCCAYGMIMFQDSWNDRHRGLGVKMNLSTALVVGLLLSGLSKVKVSIGGPDLNPVVFLGMFVGTISEEIAQEVAMSAEFTYPGGRRLQSCNANEYWQLLESDGLLRSLGSGSKEKVAWCTGTHYQNHMNECDDYHERLRATAIFSVACSSAIMMLIFLVLGKFKLTKFVSYIPTSVMEAFLSCIGYKVFKYALTFCDYDPKQFVPAACVGVTLYFMKAMHVGNPAIVIPSMLLIPLGIFYAIIYSIGGDDGLSPLEQARKDGFMFEYMDNIEFWRIWTDSVGKVDKISIKAWLATLPDLVIMLIVVVLDCLLKLSSTESKLPVKAEKDYEMQLYGLSNLFTTLCGSSVGYMQLKFNVINYGVVGNVIDQRGGALYAMMCGVCFFWSTELFNYLPKCFLGTMLFFAGAGFVAENLWGSKEFLSMVEWLHILIILAVFIITNSLLYAVIVGAILTGCSFIIKYAKVSCIQGRPMVGGEISTSERYPTLVQRLVTHISNSWLLVIRLKGFIFFASAQSMTQFVLTTIESQVDVEEHRRLRYVIFDCELLDGVDASAAKSLNKIKALADSRGVEILWSSCSDSFAKELMRRHTLNDSHSVYRSLNDAVVYVQAMVYKRAKELQELWTRVHPSFKIYHDIMRSRMAFEPFHGILGHDAARFGCPWAYCGRVKLQKGRTVLFEPGEMGRELFLIHSGAVGIFPSRPYSTGPEDEPRPLAVYRHGSFLNMDTMIHSCSRGCAVALEDGEAVFWNEHHFSRISRERPHMLSAIMTAVLMQGAAENSAMVKESELSGQGQGRATQYQDANEVNKHESWDEDLAATKVSDIQDGADEPGPSVIPEELQIQLNGILCAHGLGELGLFDAALPGEETFLPKLPECVLSDIEISFHTFAVASEGRSILQWSSVREALMYAGIFNTNLNDPNGRALTMAEFIELGNEAFMMRLTQRQIEKIKRLFEDSDLDGSGILDAIELSIATKEMLHPNIFMGTLTGIANLWATQGEGLSVEEFIGFMSRMIRKYEHEWYLLCSLRGIVESELRPGASFPRQSTPCDPTLVEQAKHSNQAGVQERIHAALTRPHPQKHLRLISDKGDHVTVDMLVNSSEGKLTLEEAKEMVWAADCCGPSNRADTIDFRLVISILLTSFTAGSKLPPTPRYGPDLCNDAVVAGMAEITPEVLAQCSGDCWDVLASSGINTLVSDFRRGSAGPALFSTYSKTDLIVSEPALCIEEGDGEDVAPRYNTLRARIFYLLEEPSSSTAAGIISVAMGLMIFASVATLVIQPLVSPPDEPVPETDKRIWYGFEIFFTCIFTVEFSLRFAVSTAIGSQTYLGFLKSPMTICDIVAICPFYVEALVDVEREEFRLFRVIRLTRLARVIRIGRLSKTSKLFAPIAMVLTVIWGIYMKTGFNK